ncbi:MAG: NAD+ synthase [Candidatus Adiutrix sp.]|jgi:NAD+ synthetase|nr:NAD+ synthase [Candidatus Adiutrix sp.]
MKYAFLQLNPKVGDLSANGATIISRLREAADQGADLCITSEMALTGYPPRDLLLFPAFVAEAEKGVRAIVEATASLPTALILGTIGRNLTGSGKPLYNQALFIQGGEIKAAYHKRLLPTYDVFDEARYFEPGDGPCLIDFGGHRLALTICEDIWNDGWNGGAGQSGPLYKLDPLARHPPFDLLINISASPFTVGKHRSRQKMLQTLSRKYAADVLYVNQVGGNDEIIFDGRSMWLTPDGQVAATAPAFSEALWEVDLAAPGPNRPVEDLSPEAETWAALTLGLGDYCRKNGLNSAVLGLSGGIDSSLVAALACEALGAGQVLGLLMPSPYSSDHSVKDALALAANLKMSTTTLSIEPAMRAYETIVASAFAGRPSDTAEENLQARIRGNLVMAFSNKFGHIPLTTGNKSEISVGYCTIYGDMCGALAVIGDLYKTEVFRLCRWLNQERGLVFPANVLSKPPSAELRPGQTDQDSLPPYDQLDAVLRLLLEERASLPALVGAGHDPEVVRRVVGLVRSAEFKRRQAAPVLKVNHPAFGLGWQMPIACRPAYI